MTLASIDCYRRRVILEFFNEMAEQTVQFIMEKHPKFGAPKILEKIREKAH